MTWKKALTKTVTSAAEIADKMNLSEADCHRLTDILDKYPMRVPEYYLNLINWDDYEHDPIYRLSIPSIKEMDLDGSFDTSGEQTNVVAKGIQHKYKQTILVLTTKECAMYCRHCFRKRLVGQEEQQEQVSDPQTVYDYVTTHPEVTNVLLSGGDSFLMSNTQIEEYLDKLSTVDTLDFLRFGTRTPVTFPERITEDSELLDILEKYNRKKQILVVTHFNHPRELTPQAKAAVKELQMRGIVVRNQTVLLKGINDDPMVLGTLLKGLTRFGAMPYYVFQCRPVVGVKNQFQVPILRGYEIIMQAKAMQNGQGKNFSYAMSHPTGKIVFIGPGEDGRMIMKYHQAKEEKNAGRIFAMDIAEDQCWVEDDLVLT